MKIDWKLALLGSLAFGFSTYYIIIFDAGHNAKAHAIGYMPLVLSGIILTFRKRYLWGFLLLTIAMALENCGQSYTNDLLSVVAGDRIGNLLFDRCLSKERITALFQIDRVNDGSSFSWPCCLMQLHCWAPREYARYSTRGNTGLTITPDGKEKKSTGLDFDYITQYSYGKLETFNLFVPRFMGWGFR